MQLFKYLELNIKQLHFTPKKCMWKIKHFTPWYSWFSIVIVSGCVCIFNSFWIFNSILFGRFWRKMLSEILVDHYLSLIIVIWHDQHWVRLSPSKENDSPSKMMKNAFYFFIKALFIFKIFKFLSWLFGHIEKKNLIRKKRLILKLMTSQPG